jgi:hypothetical protein
MTSGKLAVALGLVLMAGLVLSSPAGAVQRSVLVELFTSST